MSLVYFYKPWKHQKTSGFLIFPRGIEREQWHGMGYLWQRFHGVKSVQIWSFFWPVFSCVRTEYGDLLRKSPYLVWIQENTDQKKHRIWTLFAQCSTLRLFFVRTGYFCRIALNYVCLPKLCCPQSKGFRIDRNEFSPEVE